MSPSTAAILGYAVEIAAMIAEKHDGGRPTALWRSATWIERSTEATALVEALEEVERESRGR